MVIDNVNGFLADIGDADGLAKALLKVLSLPPEEWRKMSNAAHRTAARYSWDDATGLFEKALETAIERSGRGEFDGQVAGRCAIAVAQSEPRGK
jgi:glycosyltransferase involved in cell wall biosynthesis